MKKLYKLFIEFMLVIWGYITISSVCNIYVIKEVLVEKDLSLIVILSGIFILMLFLYYVYSKISKWDNFRRDLLAYVLCIISFILFIIVGLNLKTIPTYDLSQILDQIYYLQNNNTHIVGSSYYFSLYQHQIPIFIFIYLVESIAIFFNINPNTFMIIFTSLLTSIMFLYSYKTIKLVSNSKSGIIGLLLLMLIPDMYLFQSYYYTDILSIPFSIIGIYYLLKSERQQGYKKYLSIILSSILFTIGFKLRIVMLILLIGYLISILFKYKLSEIIKRYMTVIITICISLFIYNNFIYSYFNIKLDNKVTLPPTHWIMMGANNASDAGYYEKDVIMSKSFSNKVNGNIKEIKKRIKNNNLDFYDKKLRRMWTNGDHYGFHYRMNTTNNDLYSYIAGDNNIFKRYTGQIVLAVIYLLFLISIIRELKKSINISNSKNIVFILSIFGSILFYMLWEVQQRYSFSFIPWIVIGASSSITVLSDLLKYNVLNFGTFKLNLGKIKKFFGILLCIFVTIINIDFILDYGFRKHSIKDIVYMQNNSNTRVEYKEVRDVELIDELKQEFIVNDSFNTIKVYFNKKYITNDIDYIFELYKQDKLINKQTINTKDILKEKEYFSIKFDRVNVNKNSTYYFKLYSKEANKNNYMFMYSMIPNSCHDIYSSNNGFDSNKKGTTYIGNKKTCHDIYLVVYNSTKKNNISKKIIIPILLLNVLISYLIVYKTLLKRK